MDAIKHKQHVCAHCALDWPSHFTHAALPAFAALPARMRTGNHNLACWWYALHSCMCVNTTPEHPNINTQAQVGGGLPTGLSDVQVCEQGPASMVVPPPLQSMATRQSPSVGPSGRSTYLRLKQDLPPGMPSAGGPRHYPSIAVGLPNSPYLELFHLEPHGPLQFGCFLLGGCCQ